MFVVMCRLTNDTDRYSRIRIMKLHNQGWIVLLSEVFRRLNYTASHEASAFLVIYRLAKEGSRDVNVKRNLEVFARYTTITE
jgi:hypothetical protein